MDDILGESWVFQELIKEGLEKGEKQRLGKDLLQFVEIRFPKLLTQVKQTIEQQASLEQLQTMLNKLYRADTVEEAQVALLADG
jgi:hypothetical protein